MKTHLQLISDKTSLNINLHPAIVDILFENRKHMQEVFQSIQGFHEIDHFSLTIIDPLMTLTTFSTTPTIEYNLLSQNLWHEDPAFYFFPEDNQDLKWWNDIDTPLATKIKDIKLTKNKYSSGFSYSRKIGNFYILYSFATKYKHQNYKEYYLSHLNSLISLGDFCYRSIREIYLPYCDIYMPPKQDSLFKKIYQTKSQKYLTLIDCQKISEHD